MKSKRTKGKKGSKLCSYYLFIGKTDTLCTGKCKKKLQRIFFVAKMDEKLMENNENSVFDEFFVGSSFVKSKNPRADCSTSNANLFPFSKFHQFSLVNVSNVIQFNSRNILTIHFFLSLTIPHFLTFHPIQRRATVLDFIRSFLLILFCEKKFMQTFSDLNFFSKII